MNILDDSLNSVESINMYRSWVFPGSYDGPKARLENWHLEDLAAYCGGDYSKYEGYKERWVIGV